MKVYKHIIPFILLATLLASCNLPSLPSPTPLVTSGPTLTVTRYPSDTPTATTTVTSTPTVTPTDTPIPPPSDTPTPTPVAARAGADFRGIFEDGNITFSISADGKSVEGLRIVIKAKTRCTNGKRFGQDYRFTFPTPILINQYGFPVIVGNLSIRGWFEYPGVVRGDITLNDVALTDGSKCTIGPIDYQAFAE